MIVLGTALTFTGDPSSGRAHLLRAAEFSDQLQADPQMRAYLGAGFASSASTIVHGTFFYS